MTSAKKFGVPAHPVIFKEKTMALTIEKGIPIPNQGGGKHSDFGKAIREMEVGDSILSPIKQRNVHAYLRALKTKRFVTRSVDGGLRVWRVE